MKFKCWLNQAELHLVSCYQWCEVLLLPFVHKSPVICELYLETTTKTRAPLTNVLLLGWEHNQVCLYRSAFQSDHLLICLIVFMFCNGFHPVGILMIHVEKYSSERNITELRSWSSFPIKREQSDPVPIKWGNPPLSHYRAFGARTVFHRACCD